LSEVVRLRRLSARPVHQPQPPGFLVDPGLRRPRREFLSRHDGMAVRQPHLSGLLEPESWRSRGPRLDLHLLGTVTIIPFLPNAWAAEAGGFPLMNLPVAFLMKDVLFLAASFYLLKQDLTRAALEMATDRALSAASAFEPIDRQSVEKIV